VNWIVFSILASIGIGLMNLVPRLVATGVMTYIAVIFATGALLSLPFAMAEGTSFNAILLLIGAGVLYFFTNVSMFKALKLSPNPGMVASILQSSVILTYVLSHLLLKAKLTPIKMIGALMTIVGAIIISI